MILEYNWLDQQRQRIQEWKFDFRLHSKVAQKVSSQLYREGCDGVCKSEKFVFVREFSDELGKWLCAVYLYLVLCIGV